MGLDKNLILRNVTVQGFETAIAVLATICESCSVRLENVTLLGKSSTQKSTINPLGDPVGLLAMKDPVYPIPNLQAEGLRIEGFQSSVVWMAKDHDNSPSVHIQNVNVACLREGLRLQAHHITVEDVVVEGCRGIGLNLAEYADAIVRRAALTGNWQGIRTYANSADSNLLVEDSVFDKNEVGGLANANGLATLTGNAFQENGGAPNVGVYETMSSEVDVLHAVYTSYAPLVLRGNCIQGNAGWGVASSLLAPMDLEGNWWGSDLGPRQGGIVQGNYARPQPVTPVGDGDLVPAPTLIESFMMQPPPACDMLP